MPKNKTHLKVNVDFDFSRFRAVSEKGFDLGLRKAAIQMLDWMVSGSRNVPDKPPIRTGVLASSGSVFQDGRFLTASPDIHRGDDSATPNKSYAGKGITWGFNTDYAARMHEDNSLNPGPFSTQSGGRNPGNQWLTKHLQRDKNDFMEVVAGFVKKEL